MKKMIPNNETGRSNWQESEEIALGIYGFIQSPRSAGLLCSLLPDDGSFEVDWTQNEWVHLPLHKQWLNASSDTLMENFDTIAAMY